MIESDKWNNWPVFSFAFFKHKLICSRASVNLLVSCQHAMFTQKIELICQGLFQKFYLDWLENYLLVLTVACYFFVNWKVQPARLDSWPNSHILDTLLVNWSTSSKIALLTPSTRHNHNLPWIPIPITFLSIDSTWSNCSQSFMLLVMQKQPAM